jgi:DNA modification methylase
MQFDVADRIIGRYSMKGETVYDPFGGIGTVPLRAVKLGRLGVGCELNPDYIKLAEARIAAAEAEVLW